jgi:hypothetical protein
LMSVHAAMIVVEYPTQLIETLTRQIHLVRP